MANSEPTIDYRARYMIAQLIYPHFMEQYEQNPQNAIKIIKEYFEQIKSNNLIDSLQTLGIEPKIESIKKLIKTANSRFENYGLNVYNSKKVKQQVLAQAKQERDDANKINEEARKLEQQVEIRGKNNLRG